ncbi:BON domain-containing protein [Stutzerimonas kirkiae]|uniref:OsmY n=1 Tax=Stutzerimonas kirkiae TaxID=2211392 RepID=A0A4Q9RAY6_9GAMM|nr:BON domain-containing protein [Stutzerimonas kirkiae]TBU97920.1 osmY [Stutzerimonas kirkiae]TBV04564.1 osmY [Stutzerimonas kirkiae]TBV11600.1 osmY [Stutzerimonas kirkiae]TBV16098.1 osmY [Stutzerimonas kirkiae]
MYNVKKPLTAAAIVAVMSLPLAGVALAEHHEEQSKSEEVMHKANEKAHKAGEVVSDTWITTKVKSSLLADSATSGTDIKVETKDGIVSLSGTVASEAERKLAIEKTKEIKGVRDVAADGLKAVE